MITDNIKNLTNYTNKDKRFKLVTNFIKNNDLKSMKNGKYEIDSDDVYAIIQEYTTKSPEEGKLEAHKRYIDVQYVIDGEEKMGFAKLENTKANTFYNEENDIVFLDGEAKFFTANKDNFFIFYPEDAHMPSIKNKETSNVKKIVFKIKVN